MCRVSMTAKAMKERNMSEEEYKDYLDLRKFGSVPHGGFGLNGFPFFHLLNNGGQFNGTHVDISFIMLLPSLRAVSAPLCLSIHWVTTGGVEIGSQLLMAT